MGKKEIFVFVEKRLEQVEMVSLELISEAARLAEKAGMSVSAILLGKGNEEYYQLFFECGANKIIVVENPLLDDYVTEPFAQALTYIIEDQKPEIVLFGATAIGRDLAPRVAARIHTGLTADCTSLDIEPETNLLMMTRPTFGGNLMATIICKDYRPQMATVRPSVMRIAEPKKGYRGDVVVCPLSLPDTAMNVEILENLPRSTKNQDIKKAKVLVSAGRGIGSPEMLSSLHLLADALGGEVCATRACVDAGWINKEKQVGQTGKTVRPALYFAFGISGAVQHVVGMEEAECIIAINKDEHAPIMDLADLAIVGDVQIIVPKLIKEIEKYQER
jgi:electron transfer flavoprotein alpha subunit